MSNIKIMKFLQCESLKTNHLLQLIVLHFLKIWHFLKSFGRIEMDKAGNTFQVVIDEIPGSNSNSQQSSSEKQFSNSSSSFNTFSFVGLWGVDIAKGSRIINQNKVFI